jgi:hypothetical protein
MTKNPDLNSTSKQRNQTDSSNRTTKPNKQTKQTNKPNKQTKPLPIISKHHEHKFKTTSQTSLQEVLHARALLQIDSRMSVITTYL